ncbi:hypothetical protein A0J61_03216 [Choanephora cucurbitarum]|uniref:Uncharacterized protein n=1 Tax=Choanephora cucurbitarum TaxID=101091 RepID=A0A1C7NHY0_9FUNG|nr:hypothetical protein A0J61_03216 [Choanephora cucurbitarum]
MDSDIVRIYCQVTFFSGFDDRCIQVSDRIVKPNFGSPLPAKPLKIFLTTRRFELVLLWIVVGTTMLTIKGLRF